MFKERVIVRLQAVAFVLTVVLASLGSRAEAAADFYKKCQYFRGIKDSFAVGTVASYDIDGDGKEESIIAYHDLDEAVNQQGGVLVLAQAGSSCRVIWHGLFEKSYPSEITPGLQSLQVVLVHSLAKENREFTKTISFKKDFFFRYQDASPFAGTKVTASSTLKKPGVAPGNVFDNDLATSWAEGAEGTGADEKLHIEFKKPVQLGVIGILHGNYTGKREWRENNRVYRAEVTAETAADRFDTESDVDFEEDLGLGLYGDRIEMSFSNKPVMRYSKLNKKNVIALEVKITSVLMGEKNDDAYISEIDLAELIPHKWVTGEDESAASRKTTKKQGSPKPSSDSDRPNDDEEF